MAEEEEKQPIIIKKITKVSGYADKELVNKENPFANVNRRVTIYLKNIKSKEFLDRKKQQIEGLEETN